MDVAIDLGANGIDYLEYTGHYDTLQHIRIIQCRLRKNNGRRQAHALLEVAKHAVEIAIEDSEAAALDYLEKYGVVP